MPSSRAEWVNVSLSVIAMLGLAFGGYGHLSAEIATKEVRLTALEKEQAVSRKERNEMDNELDVLWVDTNKNKDQITSAKKDLSRFNASFEKFATAVDRLSISVVRLEERIKAKPLGVERVERK